MGTVATQCGLGRLAIAQNQLFSAVRNGELPLNGALQKIEDILNQGTFPAMIASAGRFSVWKTIKVGGVSGRSLCKLLERNCGCEERVFDVLTQKSFPTSETSNDVMLITLSPSDFGYVDDAPEDEELFNEQRLADWSRVHLSGYTVGLCDPEVGPHLRLQYLDQPKDQELWIASKAVPDHDGLLRTFVLYMRYRGIFRRPQPFLGTSTVDRGAVNSLLDTKYVFSLRKEA